MGKSKKSVLAKAIGIDNANRISELFSQNNEFYLADGVDFEWLNKMASAAYDNLVIGDCYGSAQETIRFIQTGMFSKRLEDLSFEPSFVEKVRAVEKSYGTDAVNILTKSDDQNNRNRSAHLFCRYIDAVNNTMGEDALMLQRSVSPRGGEDFDLLFFYQTESSSVINFLVGYQKATNDFKGWWQDGLEYYINLDKGSWFKEGITNQKNIDPSTGEILFGFRYDNTQSPDNYPSSNFEDLNISSENYVSFVLGQFAAWECDKRMNSN